MRAVSTSPLTIAAADIGLRGLSLLALWMILIGTDTLSVIVGLAGVVAATWASLLLVPAGTGMGTSLAVAVLLVRLPWQSLVAGIDVARRALDPRLPLRPGFVSCPSRLPPGPARNAFSALMSLQPGSMPVDSRLDGEILVHCLDTGKPVAAQIAAEEAVFRRLLGQGDRHG